MKYEITCDNCGTQFLVEAEEGQTVECSCVHCQGVMEVTIPLAGIGYQYKYQSSNRPQEQQYKEERSNPNNKSILWGVLIGLILLAGGVGAYFSLRPSTPELPVVEAVPNDTIPYESPIPVEETIPIDTVVSAPVEAPKVEEPAEEITQDVVDSVDVAPSE